MAREYIDGEIHDVYDPDDDDSYKEMLKEQRAKVNNNSASDIKLVYQWYFNVVSHNIYPHPNEDNIEYTNRMRVCVQEWQNKLNTYDQLKSERDEAVELMGKFTEKVYDASQMGLRYYYSEKGMRKASQQFLDRIKAERDEAIGFLISANTYLDGHPDPDVQKIADAFSKFLDRVSNNSTNVPDNGTDKEK